jgi:acyl-CoA dehydrogenase
MGRSFLTPEACNCSAPDTGNMEVLLKHGSLEQQQRYLVPLLQGKIRSCFLMTEPDVSSSDALNIQSRLTKVPNTTEHGTTEIKYILNGRKWWSTGAMDPRCEVALVLAKLEHSPSSSATSSLTEHHQQHTVVIVPMKSKGVSLVSKKKPLF